MNRLLRGLVTLAAAASCGHASAFCGFFVGKADADLFNDASKVVMVRDGDRTVINMLNNYQGELADFAVVVPVPVVLRKEDVKTPHRALFERIDAYSAPRLAEYFDADPCQGRVTDFLSSIAIRGSAAPQMKLAESSRDLGVKVEAQYTVGPYDIVILSAEQSDGLETWLQQNGYKIPRGASSALRPYIRLDMKFFVARVNLAEHARSGDKFLPPLQFAFRSERFMLPIKLGMLNARGPQDLVLWVLTRKGRVETTNYRTVKLPADVEIPPYVKIDKDHGFGAFYKAMFDQQARREGHRVVFTEYFWDMSWCDPCAANPLSVQELANLGVDWVGGDTSQGAQVMLTRLHVRYTRETFPEDLAFHETADRQNWQTRYVLRHPVKVDFAKCPDREAAERYLKELPQRQEKEAQTLASLTGWELGEIRARSGLREAPEPTPYERFLQWWRSSGSGSGAGK